MRTLTRREFIGSSAAFAALGGCRTASSVGSAYPGWNPGELDIHFIHTGVGEQTFFVFPDGTTMLLDCGHADRSRRPDSVRRIPARPNATLRGGQWVSRYLRRVTDRREIDYAMVSHWHGDHTDGIPDVARDFAFRHWLDHQYPLVGQHQQDADSTSIRLGREFVPAAVARGMKAESFAVGALNQIALRNDSAHRYDFEIRNLAANGVVWDGKDGSLDYAAEHVKASGRDRIEENQLSAAILIRYGGFVYYTGGDVEKTLRRADGSRVDIEAAVGRACGEVDVCKTNHHAFRAAMQAGFVSEVRARAYLSSVWSVSQVNDVNLPIMASRELYSGPRTVHFGCMPLETLEGFAGRPFVADIAPAYGHKVVKVAPGGGSYEIFTLDACDESMTVVAASGSVSSKGRKYI